MLRRALPVFLLLTLASPPLAMAYQPATDCLSVKRVTAFAPRGEVYVEVKASCKADDFPAEGPLVFYLELLVGDRAPVSRAIRLEPEHGLRSDTILFEERDFEAGETILVRVTQSGQIVSLQTVTAR